MFQIQIPITNRFDGTTPVPSSALLSPVAGSKGVYKLTDSAGADLVDVGVIPMSFFNAAGITKLQSAYIPSVGHDGSAAVSAFQAVRLVPTTSGFILGGPLRLVDPSGASGGQTGPVALYGPSDVLSLTGNAGGAQEVGITLIPMDVDEIPASASEESADAGPFVSLQAFISDIRSASSDAGQVPWDGPTIEIDSISIVASNTIAGADLVVTVQIAGVNFNPATLTIPETTVADTIVTIAPTAANVLRAGDLFTATVTGADQTATGHATVNVRGRILVA